MKHAIARVVLVFAALSLFTTGFAQQGNVTQELRWYYGAMEWNLDTADLVLDIKARLYLHMSRSADVRGMLISPDMLSAELTERAGGLRDRYYPLREGVAEATRTARESEDASGLGTDRTHHMRLYAAFFAMSAGFEIIDGAVSGRYTVSEFLLRDELFALRREAVALYEELHRLWLR